jgi:hypothetical protein
MIGADDFVPEPLLFEKCFEPVRRFPVEPRIDVDSDKFIADRNASKPFAKQPQKDHAVLAPRDPNNDSVAVFYKPVMVDTLSEQPANLLIHEGHD